MGPSYKRNHCANCKAGVFIKRKSNPLANMFTKHKQIKYGNCSCCSRLFCRDCLQQSKVATGSLRHSTSITSRGSITKSVFGSRGSMVSQKSMKKYSKKPSFGGGKKFRSIDAEQVEQYCPLCKRIEDKRSTHLSKVTKFRTNSLGFGV